MMVLHECHSRNRESKPHALGLIVTAENTTNHVHTNSHQQSKSRRCGHALCLFVKLLAFLLLVFCSPAHARECLSLAGFHPFSPGDDPAWAFPSFDDSQWKKVRVPEDLKAQGVQQKPGVGWYRIHFSSENVFDNIQTGLAMGNIGNADEVYLNGVKIGGEGIVGDRFVEAPWKERLYPVPANLLRFGEDNLLAVRILDTYRMAGIFEGPVCVGDYQSLLFENRGKDFVRKGCEIAFFTLLFFFFLVSLFLMVQKISSREYISFTVFLGLYLILFVLESLFVYELGFKSPLVQRLIFAVACFLPAAGLFFIVNLYPCSSSFWTHGLMGASILLGIGFLCFTGLSAYTILLWGYFVVAGCTGGTALFLVIRSFLLQRPEAGPVLLGTLGLLAGLIIEWAPVGGHWHEWPISPGDVGMAFLVLSMAYAMMVRYARNAKAVRALSERILAAHEEERKRISRNIHDGLGQFLPMLKLQIQMLEARVRGGIPADPSVLAGLVSEISEEIKNLRHLVADIRPEFFERTPLLETLKWHGRQFSERTGLDVYVTGTQKEVLRPRVRENLYRIVQEAFHNVEKHASARLVNVELVQKGNHVILRVADDGKGFTPSQANNTGGIGLLSMKDRAELMGGALRIQSGSDNGCAIEVEVPLT